MSHTRLSSFFLAVGILLTAGAFGHTAEVTVTRDGTPVAIVVLATNRKPADYSFKTLIAHVKQMSDATLPIVREAELGGAKVENGRLVVPNEKHQAESYILLGESELTKALGVTLDKVGPGGIVVKSGANTITLLAKDDGLDNGRYPVHARAVFRLLESWGCRYLWPGEVGKVVPRKPTVTVTDLNVQFTPPVGQRNIRSTPTGPGGYEQGLVYLGFTAADRQERLKAAVPLETEGDWFAWNGQGGNLGLTGGHAGYGLRGGWSEHGKTHPEWFALQPDGTRDQSAAGERWRLCASNSAVAEYVANDILSRLNGKAGPVISLSPNDGGYSNFCMCDACKKLDPPNGPKIKMLVFEKVGSSKRTEIDYVSLTDRYLHYWNDVATRVTAKVPDQLFLVDAYSYYSDPPVREKPHANLVVRYVPNEIEGWKGWRAVGTQRAYWRPNNLYGGGRTGAIKPTARKTAEIIQYLAANGMLATDMDSIMGYWSTQGLEYYTAARMSWDPSQSFDSLLEDYCRSGFGAGAQAMKKYFTLVETEVVPVTAGGRGQFPKITPAAIEKMRALLLEAGKATANDPASHRRVAFIRTGFEFTAISAEVHRLKEATLEGKEIDLPAAHALLEKRWQMMRAMFERQPLAVNVAFVAANDRALNDALKWKGPSATAKAGTFALPPGEDYLNEDQSAIRK